MFVRIGNELVEIASVALERSVFNDLCEEIGALGLVSLVDVLRFKELGHIALIGRDETTEFLFARFDVACDRLVVMVDGSIMSVLGPDPEMN